MVCGFFEWQGMGKPDQKKAALISWIFKRQHGLAWQSGMTGNLRPKKDTQPLSSLCCVIMKTEGSKEEWEQWPKCQEVAGCHSGPHRSPSPSAEHSVTWRKSFKLLGAGKKSSGPRAEAKIQCFWGWVGEVKALWSWVREAGNSLGPQILHRYQVDICYYSQSGRELFLPQGLAAMKRRRRRDRNAEEALPPRIRLTGPS